MIAREHRSGALRALSGSRAFRREMEHVGKLSRFSIEVVTYLITPTAASPTEKNADDAAAPCMSQGLSFVAEPPGERAGRSGKLILVSVLAWHASVGWLDSRVRRISLAWRGCDACARKIVGRKTWQLQCEVVSTMGRRGCELGHPHLQSAARARQMLRQNPPSCPETPSYH